MNRPSHECAQINLGIVPLTDCAPIAAAAEWGYYADEGLRVAVSREPSWAGLRDKLAFGLLDAAQMLAPMAPAMTLGLTGAGPFAVRCGTSLGSGGNAITISAALADEVGPLPEDADASAARLRPTVDRRARDGRPPLTFGVVFPFSNHHYQLRRWLDDGGIDVDAEVTLKVVPPPQVADRMALGALDGFCVGEPWNTVAVRAGVGRTVAAGGSLWPAGAGAVPEKVLAVGAKWAGMCPETHAALVRATRRGAAACRDAGRRGELAELLARPGYVGVSADAIRPALDGRLPVTPDHARDVGDLYDPTARDLTAGHLAFLTDRLAEAGQLESLVGPGDLAGVFDTDPAGVPATP